MNCSGAAAFGEEHRGLTCRVSATNDCHVLRIVENGLDGCARVVNAAALESFVARHGAQFPSTADTWQVYLESLRPYVDADGYLPRRFDNLVAEVFSPSD